MNCPADDKLIINNKKKKKKKEKRKFGEKDGKNKLGSRCPLRW
jgi:hypothetical protein